MFRGLFRLFRCIESSGDLSYLRCVAAGMRGATCRVVTSAKPAFLDPVRGQLATLVGNVARQLDAAGATPHHAVAECNAALEGFLEARRDPRGAEDRAADARDDLRRLARLLTVVDGDDVVFVMRQIRRVLGRFDVCGA